MRERLEAGDRDDERVVANGQQAEGVLSGLVGHRAPRVLGALVGGRYRCSWNDRALRVFDRAEDRPGGRLRQECSGPEHDAKRRGNGQSPRSGSTIRRKHSGSFNHGDDL